MAWLWKFKIGLQKREDLDWFKYVKGILDNVGAPAEIISTNEIKKYIPL